VIGSALASGHTPDATAEVPDEITSIEVMET
jgi:hypothetical protein